MVNVNGFGFRMIVLFVFLYIVFFWSKGECCNFFYLLVFFFGNFFLLERKKNVDGYMFDKFFNIEKKNENFFENSIVL